jgi:hypothetical protein
MPDDAATWEGELVIEPVAWFVVDDILAARLKRGHMLITSLPCRYHGIDLDFDQHF